MLDKFLSKVWYRAALRPLLVFKRVIKLQIKICFSKECFPVLILGNKVGNINVQWTNVVECQEVILLAPALFKSLEKVWDHRACQPCKNNIFYLYRTWDFNPIQNSTACRVENLNMIRQHSKEERRMPTVAVLKISQTLQEGMLWLVVLITASKWEQQVRYNNLVAVKKILRIVFQWGHLILMVWILGRKTRR